MSQSPVLSSCIASHYIGKDKTREKNLTPLRPIYSAICPLAMAPTIAPTLDSDPNRENCTDKKKGKQHQVKDKHYRG